ncbi:DUF7289 family protein [Halovenus sp. HT40]|uniref:DUF7289 family protein n=1 Tax=Halovenus sp. HT40 TaxID=3126691 RepID=UPI00300ED02D
MRAQSHIVGVALMLGVAVLALGTLTAGVGTLIDSQTADADAQRVADGFDRAIQGAERTGVHSHQLHFAEGTLRTVDRTMRILENGTVVAAVEVDALVYEHSEGRVVSLGGAVVRDSGASAALAEPPSITHSKRNEVLIAGAPKLNAGRVSISGGGGVTTTIQTNVSHDRRELGTGRYAVAIETASPDPFRRFFADQGATVESRQFSGDETESVVATYPGLREGYLVVHDLRLEVSHA